MSLNMFKRFLNGASLRDVTLPSDRKSCRCGPMHYITLIVVFVEDYSNTRYNSMLQAKPSSHLSSSSIFFVSGLKLGIISLVLMMGLLTYYKRYFTIDSLHAFLYLYCFFA